MIKKTIALFALTTQAITGMALMGSKMNNAGVKASLNDTVETRMNDMAVGESHVELLTKLDKKFPAKESEFKFAFSEETSLRDVKTTVDGCEIKEISFDKTKTLATVKVAFKDGQGSFSIGKSEEATLRTSFVKRNEDVVLSAGSLENALHNEEVIRDLDKDLRIIDEIPVVRGINHFSATKTYEIHGKLQFRTASDELVPFRFAKVQIRYLDANGNDVVYSTVYSDDDGIYRTRLLNVESDKVYVKVFAAGVNTKVVDEYGQEYSQESKALIPIFQATFIKNRATLDDKDLILPSVISSTGDAQYNCTFEMDTAMGKAVSVAQGGILSARFIRDLNNSTDIRDCTIHYPAADSGCYYTGNNHIYITGSARRASYLPESYYAYDVIAHEYGHHVQSVFGITQNPGGTHYTRHNAEDDFYASYSPATARDRGIKLAYAEGWATAYSMLMQDYYKYYLEDFPFCADDSYTSYNGVDVNYNIFEVCLGEGAEESVTSFITNLVDNDNDSVDQLSSTVQEFWQLSTINKPTTFSKFMENVYERGFDEEKVAKLLAELQMVPGEITVKGNYLNIAPTFEFRQAGGSRYFPNDKFVLYLLDNEGELYDNFILDSRNISNGVVSFTYDYDHWYRFIEENEGQFSLYVECYCTAYQTTGAYRSETFTFDMPTECGVSVIQGKDWGFKQQYFGQADIDNAGNKTPNLIKDVYNIRTEKLRCAYINEGDCVVLSPKKKNEGKAYLEMYFVDGRLPTNYELDLALWRSVEDEEFDIKPTQWSIKIETLDDEGIWTTEHIIRPTSLMVRGEGYNTFDGYECNGYYGLRITMTSPATGSSNKGRLCLLETRLSDDLYGLFA